jgi:hypothetical protein
MVPSLPFTVLFVVGNFLYRKFKKILTECLKGVVLWTNSKTKNEYNTVPRRKKKIRK